MSRAEPGGTGPVPRESAHRCALRAQLRGDPMAGTALPHARLLLVEQPGPWGPRGLVDSRADPDVAQEVDVLAAAAGLRLQAVRRPGRHAEADGSRLVGVADTTERVVHRWRTPDLPALVSLLRAAAAADPATARAGLLAQAREAGEVTADRDPLYLVCTHGRHDACCALRGRPLVDALHAERPGRVWETTHVGGDRFAANLLVLPSGDSYGRVLPFAAADLVTRVERGEVVPGLMRGRMGLAPVVQAALVLAHEQLVVPERDALRVLAVDRRDPDLAEVTLDSPAGHVVVEVASTTGDAERLTCRGPASARARVHRGVRIRPATS